MADASRTLSQQIAAVKHAAQTLAADEEFAPGLNGAVNTLAWTERNADTIRAVVEFIKAMKRPDALEILSDFTKLALERADIVDVLRKFIDVSGRHPEIMQIIDELPSAGMPIASMSVRSVVNG